MAGGPKKEVGFVTQAMMFTSKAKDLSGFSEIKSKRTTNDENSMCGQKETKNMQEKGNNSFFTHLVSSC